MYSHSLSYTTYHYFIIFVFPDMPFVLFLFSSFLPATYLSSAFPSPLLPIISDARLHLVLGQILDSAGAVGRRVHVGRWHPGAGGDVALEVEGIVDLVDLIGVLAQQDNGGAKGALESGVQCRQLVGLGRRRGDAGVGEPL